MSRYRETVDPLVVVRAEGSRLFDADGSSYIDANASWWTSTLGHNHPKLVEALQRQAEKVCHTALAGITHPYVTSLAERICGVAPQGLEHVFFSDNGSTAVEVAMKLADSGVRVIVAGLDQDYLRRPFGPMPAIMALAEHVDKMHAICIQCGGTAHYSQRISGSNEQVQVGDTENYEARCRDCYVPFRS